jgi:hypothetical protein
MQSRRKLLPMSIELEEAIEVARKLPADKQELAARLILSVASPDALPLHLRAADKARFFRSIAELDAGDGIPEHDIWKEWDARQRQLFKKKA